MGQVVGDIGRYDCFQYSRRRFSFVVVLATVVLASLKLFSMLSRRIEPVGLEVGWCNSWLNGWNPGAPSFRILKLWCWMCRLWAMTMIVAKSRKRRQVFLIILVWKLEMNWWVKWESSRLYTYLWRCLGIFWRVQWRIWFVQSTIRRTGKLLLFMNEARAFFN